MPHPEKPKGLSPYEIWGRKKVEETILKEMSPVEKSRREHAISELLRSAETFQTELNKWEEVYEPALKESGVSFWEMNPLVEVAIRICVLVKEEEKNGPEYAMIGKVFAESGDDIEQFSSYISKYLETALQFWDLIGRDHKFKKKMKVIKRRNNLSVGEILDFPVQQLIRYSKLLESVLKYTPEWHNDYEMLKTALGMLKEPVCEGERVLTEVSRQKKLGDIERKVRNCPPLRDGENIFIGTWEMTSENMLIHVLSNIMIIVEQRVEFLSRKKYFVIKRLIEMNKVQDVVRDSKGIILRMIDRGEITVMVSFRGDELLDAVKTIIQ